MNVYDHFWKKLKNSNNLIEQGHRFIKKISKPMMGFKTFYSAKAAIEGIETAHMIWNGQLSEENMPLIGSLGL